MDARGDAAQARWAELIQHADETFKLPHSTLMWSAPGGETRALARMEWPDNDDRGYPPGTGGWGESRDEQFRVVAFFVWGEKLIEVLVGLESAAT